MNTTTITISERTRRELLKVAAELQARRGRKTDYEDVIEYLLAKTRRNPDLLRRATSPKGIPISDLHRLLEKGRAEDRRHEEELERYFA
jgi:predicted CopG family antitoxin